MVRELRFTVSKRCNKGGTPMFDETITYDNPKTALELLSAEKCDDSNNFDLRYKVTTKA